MLLAMNPEMRPRTIQAMIDMGGSLMRQTPEHGSSHSRFSATNSRSSPLGRVGRAMRCGANDEPWRVGARCDLKDGPISAVRRTALGVQGAGT